MLAFQPNFPTRLRDNFAAQPGGNLLAIENRQAELQALIALVSEDRRVRDCVDDACAEERWRVALADVDFGDSVSAAADGLDAGGRVGGLG